MPGRSRPLAMEKKETILDRIVAVKREEIARLPMPKPDVAALRAAIERRGGVRDFFGALQSASPHSLALIAEVAATYFRLLDFHQRLAISAYTLESRMESLKIIQQRFDKGIISELDVNQAQIQKEIAAGAIPLYQRSIAKTENGLASKRIWSARRRRTFPWGCRRRF